MRLPRPTGRTGPLQYVSVLILLLLAVPTDGPRPAGPHREGPSGDRGDVPGWVMITMMTAIVVIVLLGVFQEAVVTAVKNAFDSISGQASP